MDHASPAERALYSDLTRLFMSMKDAPHAQVEASIEERFRAFLRAHPDRDVGTLQITLSWTFPEGAEDWAIYRTDYRTLPAEVVPERCRAVAGAQADIVEFPGADLSRSITQVSGPARIIPLPGH
jgi:hypothetical protein